MGIRFRARKDSFPRSNTTICSRARLASRSRFRVSAIRTAVPRVRRAARSQARRHRPGRGARLGWRQRAAANSRRTGASQSVRARRQRFSSAPPGRLRCSSASPAPPSPRLRRPPVRQTGAVQDHRQLVSRRGSVQPGAGVVQNIFGAMRIAGRAWASTFTQEWPAPSQTHQLSYTIAFFNGDQASGFGDTLMNYRYQVAEEGPGRPAFAPRVSLVLPTGNRGKGLGDGTAGLQFNLPISKQLTTGTCTGTAGSHGCRRRRASLAGNTSRNESGTIWSPRSSPAARSIGSADAEPDARIGRLVRRSRDRRAERRASTTYTLSPGFRGGWNLGDAQIVTGFALPIVWTERRHNTGAFVIFRTSCRSGSEVTRRVSTARRV